MKYELVIAWGCAQTRRALGDGAVKTYSFNTEAEQDAFRLALHEGMVWQDYAVIDERVIEG